MIGAVRAGVAEVAGSQIVSCERSVRVLWTRVVAAAVVLAVFGPAFGQGRPLVPFVLPWNDTAAGPTDLSGWDASPAGKFGPVRAGADGHLYVGKDRIRFFGTNLCYGGVCPDKPISDAVAGRLAKFGFNCVRLHHMDSIPSPEGLIDPDAAGSGALDPAALDRFDYLAAQLEKHGIYLDINLLVARRFRPADGLPREVALVKDLAGLKALAMFDPRLVALQKDYARTLLTHRNPYTKRTYARDPAVAFIEVNNEAGLMHAWLSGALDKLPAIFREELCGQWWAWLGQHYGSAAGVERAWGQSDPALPEAAKRRKMEPTLRHDWIAFLWETERGYWRTMRQFLKEDLKVDAVVVGTIVGCSTPNLTAEFDASDTHAYWQAPRYPGRRGDRGNWHIENRSMVNDPAATLAKLAGAHVAGKPMLVTEYSHPAPNTYGSEAPLMLAAFAAAQDFDAIFLYAYHHNHDRWDVGHVRNFFDIDQNPSMMVNVLQAAAMFRRGDIPRFGAVEQYVLTPQREVDAVAQGGRAWRLCDAKALGLDPDSLLDRRFELRLNGEAHNTPASGGPNAVVFDTSRSGKSVMTVNAPREKAVVGFIDGRAFELGGVTIAPGPTRQDWCTVSVSLIEGESLTGGGRAIVSVTGYAENTAMGWKDEQRSTVGRDWGRSPSLVEVPAVTLTLPVRAERVKGWALDERGQQGSALKVTESGDGRAVLHLGPPQRTLWYELVIR